MQTLKYGFLYSCGSITEALEKKDWKETFNEPLADQEEYVEGLLSLSELELTHHKVH